MIRIFQQYVSPKSVLLRVIEGFLIAGSILGAASLRFWKNPLEFEDYVRFPDFPLQLLAIVVMFQICFHYNDLYDLSTHRRRYEQVMYIGSSLGLACILLGALYYVVPRLIMGRSVLLIAVGLSSALMILNRIALDRVWAVAAPKQNVLIVGARELASNVAREFLRREDLNVRVVGLVTAEAATSINNGPAAECPIIGSTANLENLVKEHRVSRIVVAMEDRRGKLPIQQLVSLRVAGVLVEDAESAIAALSGRIWLSALNASWFVFSDGFRRSRAILASKRTLDLCFGMLGLAISSPLMLLIAIAIRLDSKGPAIYRQERVGYKGRCFEVLKFRSMRADAEKENGAQWAQKNDHRVTRVGKVLRKFRLDELPQFVNVIRGDMSFVGPRPERPAFVTELRKEIPYYDERHSVRPGLTGWAQVQYCYGASKEDALRKLEYDLFYLKNLSIPFDCAIILQTIRIVVTGRGAQ